MDVIRFQQVILRDIFIFEFFMQILISVFVTGACCCAAQVGLHPWLMFWCCMFSYIAFYCAHWQTYVSGKLRFGK